MNKSKYDQFWGDKIELLAFVLKQVVESGEMQKFRFVWIMNFGDRQTWQGTVVLYDGKIVLGGNMAHMKSLGKLLAPYTSEHR